MFRQAMQRLRRSIAQRGFRNALGHVVRRLWTGDLAGLAAGPADRETHPFDVECGVDTSGFVHGSGLGTGHPFDRYSVAYYASAPSLVRAMLGRWSGTAVRSLCEYTFVDFGSGKGRVVLLASEFGFRRCVGVELNPALHEIALHNVGQWQQLGRAACPIEVLCQEATSYVFPPTPCVVYLFNPFTDHVLARLLDSIEAAFADRPGELDLIYVNAEFQRLLEQRPGFQRLWQQSVSMSPQDAAADLLYQADASGNRPYGEAGQEPCSAWRFVGLPPLDPVDRPAVTNVAW